MEKSKNKGTKKKIIRGVAVFAGIGVICGGAWYTLKGQKLNAFTTQDISTNVSATMTKFHITVIANETKPAPEIMAPGDSYPISYTVKRADDTAADMYAVELLTVTIAPEDGETFAKDDIYNIKVYNENTDINESSSEDFDIYEKEIEDGNIRLSYAATDFLTSDNPETLDIDETTSTRNCKIYLSKDTGNTFMGCSITTSLDVYAFQANPSDVENNVSHLHDIEFDDKGNLKGIRNWSYIGTMTSRNGSALVIDNGENTKVDKTDSSDNSDSSNKEAVNA